MLFCCNIFICVSACLNIFEFVVKHHRHDFVSRIVFLSIVHLQDMQLFMVARDRRFCRGWRRSYGDAYSTKIKDCPVIQDIITRVSEWNYVKWQPDLDKVVWDCGIFNGHIPPRIFYRRWLATCSSAIMTTDTVAFHHLHHTFRDCEDRVYLHLASDYVEEMIYYSVF